MRKNTTRYFEAIKEYRKAMLDFSAEYDKAAKVVEQYRGSAAYSKMKKELDNTVEQSRAEIVAHYRPIIDGIIADMEKTYQNKPATVPTQEQLAVVQMLKMRDSVSKEELKQAANTCKGCWLAVQALREIAGKSGVLASSFLDDDTSTSAPNFNTLRKQTGLLLSLDKVNNRYEWTNTRQYDKFVVDFDPVDSADCFRAMGCVSDFDSFSGMVDE